MEKRNTHKRGTSVRADVRRRYIRSIMEEEARPLKVREVEALRNKAIKCKDKAVLKRLRKKLIKLNEYRWLMKQMRKEK